MKAFKKLMALLLVVTMVLGMFAGLTITAAAAYTTAAAGEYTLVNDASMLQAGDSIIIVDTSNSYAMSTTQNGNNRGAVSGISANGNTISLDGTLPVQCLVLEAGNITGTWALNTGKNNDEEDDGLLYAASSGSNYLRTETQLSNNSSWDISFSEDNAVVVAQGTNTRNIMRFNTSSSVFSCYASGQTAIKIYKRNAENPAVNATIEILVVDDTQNTSFFIGDEFVPAPITGLDADMNEYDLTDWCEYTGYNMNAAGTYTVTATYNRNSTGDPITETYTITVSANPVVTFYNNGTESSTVTVPSGTTVARPADPAAVGNYTFLGWTTAESYYNASVAPTYFDFTSNITQNTSLYAVYAQAGGSGSTDSFTLTNTLTAGDYVLGALVGTAGEDNSLAAMNATVESGWQKYTLLTPAGGVITNSDAQYIWTLAGDASTGFSLCNKSTGTYLTLGTGTGSGSVTVGATAANIYASVADAQQSSFELHAVSTATASSDNQLCCNLGSGYGYRMYAQRAHGTTTGGISTQMRFYKAGASYTNYTTTLADIYTVTWTNGESSSTTQVMSGTAPVYTGDEPTKADDTVNHKYYTFAGWAATANGTALDLTAQTITDETEYFAVFTEHSYAAVSWSIDGAVETTYVKGGDTPVYPNGTPTKPDSVTTPVVHYTFTGWTPDPAATTIEDGQTYSFTAQFSETNYVVSISPAGGTIEQGSSASLSASILDTLGAAVTGFTPSWSVLSADGKATLSATTGSTVTLNIPNDATANETVVVTVTYSDGTNEIAQTATFTVMEVMSKAFTLITSDNVPANWSGEYIIAGRKSNNTADVNNYILLKADGTDQIKPNYENGMDFADSGISWGDGTVTLDTLAGGTVTANSVMQSDNSDLIWVIELVDPEHGYYTIREKNHDVYIAADSSVTSGSNTMSFSLAASAAAQWTFDMIPVNKTSGAYVNDILCIRNVMYTWRCLLFNTVGQDNPGRTFRHYFVPYAARVSGDPEVSYPDSNTYNNNSEVFNSTTGADKATQEAYIGRTTHNSYNIYLFGNRNPFTAQILYQGEQRTIVNPVSVQVGRTSAVDLTGLLSPDVADFANYTLVSGPTWEISSQSNSSNLMTIDANGNLLLNGAATGDYALVTLKYVLRDTTNALDFTVSTQAKVQVVAASTSYATVIYETATGNMIEQSYTVSSNVNSLGLATYLVDESNDQTSLNPDCGFTVSGNVTWTATSTKGNAVSVSDNTLDLSAVTGDDLIVVRASGQSGTPTGGEAVAAEEGIYYIYVTAATSPVIAQITHTENDAQITGNFTAAYGATSVPLSYQTVVESSGLNAAENGYTIGGTAAWSILSGTGATINANTGALNVSGCAEGTIIVVRLTGLTETDDQIGTSQNIPAATVRITVGEEPEITTVSLKTDVIVVDFGKPVVIHPLANDEFPAGTTYAVTGIGTPAKGTAVLADNTVTYTPPANEILSGKVTISYTVTADGNAYSNSIIIIPANNLYYEVESGLFTFAGEWTRGTLNGNTFSAGGSTLVSNQAEDRPGSGNAYGFDPGYAVSSTVSDGSLYKTNVQASSNNTATFEFAGTGFEINSFCSSDTGFVVVEYYANAGGSYPAKPTRSLAVDTYVGYSYTEEPMALLDSLGNPVYNYTEVEAGTGDFSLEQTTNTYTDANGNLMYVWDYVYVGEGNGDFTREPATTHWAAQADDSAYFNVPVLKVVDLPYGKYKVVVRPIYFSVLDHAETGSDYDFYLDSVRIFDPCGTAAALDTDIAEAYDADSEYGANYISIRSLITKSTANAGNYSIGIRRDSTNVSGLTTEQTAVMSAGTSYVTYTTGITNADNNAVNATSATWSIVDESGNVIIPSYVDPGNTESITKAYINGSTCYLHFYLPAGLDTIGKLYTINAEVTFSDGTNSLIKSATSFLRLVSAAQAIADPFVRVTGEQTDWSGDYLFSGVNRAYEELFILSADNGIRGTKVHESYTNTGLEELIPATAGESQIHADGLTEGYAMPPAQITNIRDNYVYTLEPVGATGYYTIRIKSVVTDNTLNSYYYLRVNDAANALIAEKTDCVGDTTPVAPTGNSFYWTVSYGSDGVQIMNVAAPTMRLLMNGSSTRHIFNAYANKTNGSGGYTLELYKKNGTTPIADNTISIYADGSDITDRTISAGKGDTLNLTAVLNNALATGETEGSLSWTAQMGNQTLTVGADGSLVIPGTAEVGQTIVITANKTVNKTNAGSRTFTATASVSIIDTTAYNWELVTDINELATGMPIVIVADAASFALGNTQNTSNRSRSEVTVNADKSQLAIAADTAQLTLENGALGGTFLLRDGAVGYLYTATNSGNTLKTQAAGDADASWSISITDGIASISKSVSGTERFLGYYNSAANGVFASYTTMANHQVRIYKQASACAHTWDAGVVTTPATCGAVGTTTYTCSTCSQTRTTAIEALSHDLVEFPAAAADCTTAGNIQCWACNNCNKWFTDAAGTSEIAEENTIIPATGHTVVNQPAVPATCTENGLTAGSYCSVCSEVLTEQTVIPATGHDYSGTVTTAATCTTAGVMTYTCGNCGDSYTETIPATGHIDENGDYVCDVCGTELTAPDYSGTYYIAAHRTDENFYYMSNVLSSAKLGAQDSGLTTLPASIDAPMSDKVFVLTRVGNTTYTIYALGISGDINYINGSSTATTMDITNSASATTFTVTANGDGTLKISNGARNLGLSTTGTYAFAMYTYSTIISNLHLIPATGTVSCAHTGLEEYTAQAATCTVDGNSAYWYCPDCNKYFSDEGASLETTLEAVTISATGHTVIEDAAVAATCTTTGLTAGSHCSVCQEVLLAQTEIASLGHDFGAYSSNNNGVDHTRSCSRCDVTQTENCSWGIGVETTAPTATVPGVMTYTCSVCAGTKTEEIPALGQSFTVSFTVPDGVTANAMTCDGGDSITLPTPTGTPTANAQTYSFAGWVTTTVNNSTDEPTILTAGSSYTPSENVTLLALYTYTAGGGGTGGDYQKVTTAPANWAGEYLIVYEEENMILDGSLTTLDASNNYQSVTIENETIPATAGDAYKVTIAGSTDSWTIQTVSGYYIGATSNANTMNSSTSNAYTNSLALDADGNATVISSGGAYLRFNTSSGQDRFRYYKSGSYSSQKPIALYAKSSGGGSATTYYTTVLETVTACTHENLTATAAVAATCTTAGNSAYWQCADCNKYFSDSAATTVITPASTEIAALGHNFGAWSYNNNNLSHTRTCTRCNVETETENCTWGTGSVTTPATATTPGVITYTCKVCSGTKTGVIPAIGTGPATPQEVDYLIQNGRVANWGSRGATATFLTTYAQSYYTGSYTYATLAANSGATASSSTASDIYNSDLGSALHSMVAAKQTTTTSYDGTKDMYCFTDCLQNDIAHISSYYSGTQLNAAWDSGATWNREHTWPNSKGLGSSDENDVMMLRPTSTNENGARGNLAYGSGSGYYDPNEISNNALNLHGDVARLMLQHFIRWGNTQYLWGASGVFESRAVMLQWLEEDPVDTWEMGRNDAVQSITGVRNVFVDYPELAFQLLGADVPTGYTTPSTGGGSVTPTTYAIDVSGQNNGTVTATPNPAAAGATVTLTATPDTGYSFSEWTVLDGNGDEVTVTNNTFTMPASDVIVEASFVAAPVTGYTVTLNDSGTTSTVSGTTVTLPTGAAGGDYTFVGWTTSATPATDTQPATIAAGSYTPTADITLYALYSYTQSSGGSSDYVLTDVADIGASDEVVITVLKSGSYIAMSNANGTSSAPSAITGVEISGNKITSTVSDNMKWNIVYNIESSNFVIYPNGTTATWLYCTATNNGVRVGGTNTNNTFVIDSTSGYLKHSETNRYLGVYNTQDWRCYTSATATNIANQTLGFYVKAAGGGTPTTYYSTEITRSAGMASGAPEALRSTSRAASTGNTSGIVFINGNGAATIEEYAAYGPNNEVYLAPGQAVSFSLDVETSSSKTPRSIQVGMKTVSGSSAVQVHLSSDTAKTINVTSSAEMYYDVTDIISWGLVNGGYASANALVITNNSSSGALLSLTNVKWTVSYADGAGDINVRAIMDQKAAVQGLAVVNALLENETPIDPEQPDEPEQTPDTSVLKFRAASLNLENGISTNFIASATVLDSFESCWAVIRKAGAAEQRIEAERREGDLYFTYYGSTATDMGAEFTATLYGEKDGVTYEGAAKSYSIKQYAMNKLNNAATSDVLKTLCVDLLNYGAAAQSYKGVDTQNLPNAELTAEMRAYASDLSEVVLTDHSSKQSIRSELGSIRSASLNLMSNIELNYYLQLPSVEGAELTLEYVSGLGEHVTQVLREADFRENGSYYVAAYTGLKATDLRSVITATLRVNGETAEVVTYSVESYAARKLQGTDETLKALVQSIMVYADAACSFFED